MKPKQIVTSVLLLFVAASVATLVLKQKTDKSPEKSTASAPEAPVPLPPTKKIDPSKEKTFVYAYYFHGTARCRSCLMLEEYSFTALTDGFKKKLDSGDLVFETINYDVEQNRHYIEDFGLTTKSLVLVEKKQGQIGRWKNLDQIWMLLRDRNGYLDYVRRETRQFMEGSS